MALLQRFGLKKTQPKPMMAEVAPSEALHSFGGYFKEFTNPDAVLKYESAGKNYDLYYNMMRDDGYLSALLHTRFHTAASLDWTVLPHDENDANAVKQAEFITAVLERFKRFPEAQRDLLYGIYLGFMPGEIMWEFIPTGPYAGMIGVADIIARHNNRFKFDASGNLLYVPPNQYQGSEVPPYKFVVLKHRAIGENPYGMPLAQPLYWMVLFKKFALRWGNVALEKFGMPTVWAKFKGTLNDTERAKLEERLASIQAETNIATNDTIDLSLLDAKVGGKEAAHWTASHFWNEQMTVTILGQTLTTGEGARSGSLALGQVHGDVRDDYLQADARSVMLSIDRDVVRPLVDFNFPPNIVTGYPSFVIHYEPPSDLDLLSQIIERLVAKGMPIPISYIRDQFTIPEPEAGEPILTPPQAFPASPGSPADEPPSDDSGDRQNHSALPVIHTHDDGSVHLAATGTWKTPPEGTAQYVLGASIKVEEKFRRILRRIYGNLEEQIIHDFVNSETPEKILDAIDDIVVQYYENELSGAMPSVIEESIRQTAKDLAAKLSMTFNKKLFSKLTKGYLQKRGYEKGAMKELGDTLRQVLSDNIGNILESGGSIDDMATAIRESISSLGQAKAEQIAISETQMASNWSALEMGRRSPLDMEAWFVGDTESCDVCYEWSGRNPWTIADAQNDLYPHPGCRCHWILTPKEK